MSDIVGSLLKAGLTLAFLDEHDSLPWRCVPMMVQGADRMFRFPGGIAAPPAAFSLRAGKR